MEWIVGIMLVSTLGWLGNNWIRAKHGYELEDEWGGKTGMGENVQTKQLREENAALKGQIDQMQDRMVVLEKIVTDRGYGLREEIEALRDSRPHTDSGVPLDIARKEQV
ncbi:hypothetical protein [Parerythrobacter lacustris]|uniref:Uncharacterized protein n=1 Tax=Parerythrobacter lacustris TaxID=2969984 RepID=A0ABT1XN94_9SPHN|nr:hypothetical protein [Parerythrobacter lacustris]MCR2833120.1 hypothetical protein [Parerythrobacter lacustris]